VIKTLNTNSGRHVVSGMGRKFIIRLHQATRTTALGEWALWRNSAERNAREIHPIRNRNIADKFFLYEFCGLSILGFRQIWEWDFRRCLMRTVKKSEAEAGRPCGGMDQHLESLWTTAGMFIILCLLFWVCALSLFLSLSPFVICVIKFL